MEARNASRCVFAVISFIVNAGCATVANRHTARPISADGVPLASTATLSGLTISGEEMVELSSEHFGALAVTFENPTNEWVHIESINLDFGSQSRNESILIPWGENILSWQLATAQRNAIRRTNTETALSLLAVGGAITARAGGRSAVGAVGGIVALGSIGALWAKAIDESMTAATFPPSHLFATPFAVPPGLFAKKWVLLSGTNAPGGGCISSMNMAYDVTGKGRERVHLVFGRGGSDWQKAACRGSG